MTVYQQLVALESEGVPFVLVTLVEALGSTPQDAAAKMIVTAEGLHCGTVGGGRVEAAALKLASEILCKGDNKTQFVSWTLKGDVGMTCGGSVKFYFEPHFGPGPWTIAVFGAGHISQALIPVLIPLPCSLQVIDSRPEWLERLPRSNNLRCTLAERPEDIVSALPELAYLVVMTKGHTTDRPILRQALLQRSFPYIGVIGSEAKAEVLRRELLAEGVPPEKVGGFHCPIGLDFGSNHPHEIALSIAAQLVSERDRIRSV